MAGMLLLLFGSVTAGILLWSASTVGGLFALWYIRSTEKKEEPKREEEKDEEQ